jgi:PST family polysaccharide transporter
MWRGAVPILSSLAIVGFLRIANNPNGLVTQARAQVMAEAMRQTAFMVSIALFVFIGTFFGVQGVVVGIGLASLVFLVMMTRLALRVSGVSFKQWLSALRSAIIGSTAMGATALGVKFLLFGRLPVVPLLAIVVCGAVLAYLVSLRLCLTMDERHILEALLTILPTPLKKLLEFFLGSARGSQTHRQSGGSSVRSEESLVKLK